MQRFDVTIIGGGIVGLATAYQLARSAARPSLIVLEKESELATHQTGRNSGVLHSGIYYKPGSLKARNCRQGKLAMQKFCQDEGIEFDICGKVIVALDQAQLNALNAIFSRGQENGVACEIIDRKQLNELEPHVNGVGAISVPEAGIVDYRQVCHRIAEIVVEKGGAVRTSCTVRRITPLTHSTIIHTNQEEIESRMVVNCAGLHCDRVTKLAGDRPDAKIVPFRGEYFELIPEVRHLCRNLIYPVPDPKFPFLGIHFTRMIDGSVECGPNAVLAFAREGYSKTSVNAIDLIESLTYQGFWRLALKHWRMGLAEMWRSMNKGAFVKALQQLIPDIRDEHLTAAPAGVRAQALLPNGKLVDDFLIVESPHIISINNAPSPAATAALSIGQTIADKVVDRL